MLWAMLGIRDAASSASTIAETIASLRPSRSIAVATHHSSGGSATSVPRQSKSTPRNIGEACRVLTCDAADICSIGDDRPRAGDLGLARASRVGDDAVGSAAEGDQVREHRLEDAVLVAARCAGWGGRSDDAGREAAYEPARRGVGRRSLWRTKRVDRRIELRDSNASGGAVCAEVRVRACEPRGSGRGGCEHVVGAGDGFTRCVRAESYLSGAEVAAANVAGVGVLPGAYTKYVEVCGQRGAVKAVRLECQEQRLSGRYSRGR